MDARLTNLPARRTPLIGRDADLAAVRDLVLHGDLRLVTLTGAPGVGKTSLALEVARAALGEMPDGVWQAGLELADSQTAPAALVAEALGLTEDAGREPAEQLVSYLQPRQALLLLDNCEHIAARCGELIDLLLGSCPDLRVLATSRTPLHVAGEATFAVEALAAQEPEHLPALDELARVPAVSLFVERARAVRHAFELTQENARAVAEICYRLDGLPLALELAAARVAAFTPAEIARRLASPEFLGRHGRGGPARHETLRAALDWSYDLLSQREQELFRWLGVFAPGWTVEATEAICARISGHAPDVLAPLAALVDQSLIIAEEVAGTTRYRRLAPVREYALERLDAQGELEAARRAHAWYYRELAERVNTSSLSVPPTAQELAALEREHQNFLAAARWAEQEGDADTAVRLCIALWNFWRVRGHLRIGDAHLEAALALAADIAPSQRVVALLQAANYARRLGDRDRARKRLHETLALARALPDPGVERLAVALLGGLARDAGDFRRGRELYGQAVALAESAGDRHAVGWMLGQLGLIVQREGHDDEAEGLLQRSWEISDVQGATTWHKARALARLGSFLRGRGESARAARLLREAIGYFQAFHARPDIAGCLKSLALVASDEGQPVRAATLFGAASALQESTGAELADDTLQVLAGDVDNVRQSLGERSFAAAWSRGRGLAADEAVEMALSVGEVAPQGSGDSPLAALTPREHEVARLVAEGLTNAQIAERLVVSEGTARTHLERIRRKLGCRSRVQVATLVTQEQRQLRQP